MSLSARKIPGDADRADLLLAFEDITARSTAAADLVADAERKDRFIAMLGANNGNAPEGATPPLAAPRTRRVLVVDDHEGVAGSVARLVREWGHEVAIARDGPSALLLADSFQPECAIVDLSLPGMSGIDLARALRKVFPPQHLYLIALTGFAGAAIREACLAAGFDVHLVKPGEIELLERFLGGDRPASETTSL